MMLGVLVKAGINVRSREIFYKLVVQAVLMYRRDTWVVTDAMVEVLEGFRHRIARRIMGKMPRQFREKGW